MAPQSTVPVYLESGKKRVFAVALDWPGWCLSGSDEESALAALLEAGPRYARIVSKARLSFQAPDGVSAFDVVERVPGTNTTDFGAPDVSIESDERPVDDAERRRMEAVLKACWQAFDDAVEDAAGKELRKGPRGGGRELEGIERHVLGAEAAYLSALGWKFKADESADIAGEKSRTRAAIVDGLEASVRGEIPAKGPRGGRRWLPRYFVRRTAWHLTEHTWEIEDRAVD